MAYLFIKILCTTSNENMKNFDNMSYTIILLKKSSFSNEHATYFHKMSNMIFSNILNIHVYNVV